jgi:hypothetical protein
MNNLIWRMFMLQDYRERFVNWEQVAYTLLAEFRSRYLSNLEDDWYPLFVEELSSGSLEFREWWMDYEVRCMGAGIRQMNHPKAGRLNFASQLFFPLGTIDLILNVFTPDLQDGSIENLSRLEE